MIKLLIADDEQHIIQLVRKLTDFERFDLELVGEATDGLTALHMVETLKPDILITDIKMPCLDGLELIEKIREKGLPISIIVISGHKQFDYAYSAIKYRVDDFIIKPINREDLNGALGRICTSIRNAALAASDGPRPETAIWNSRSQFIEDAVSRVVKAASIEQLNQDYTYRFGPGYFTGICIKLDLPELDGDFSAVMQKCLQATKECLNDYCIDMEFIISDYKVLGIINTESPNRERKIKKLFEAVSLKLDMYSGIVISIGVGRSVDSIAKIPDTINDAITCHRIKCVLDSLHVYYAEEFDLMNSDRQLTGKQSELLRVLMESGDIDGIDEWVRSVFNQPVVFYKSNPIYALALADSVAKTFFSICEILRIELTPDIRQRWSLEMGNVRGFEQMAAKLVKLMKEIIETDYQKRLQRESYHVSCVKEYVAAHLSEQIKLEDIAQNVLLSPSYLSMLFKKETGTNISDYIQYLRLEEAKRLLKTTNLYVNEIAERVGYTDPKHFSKMFKKQIGSKPLEYRKLYSW